METVIYCSLQGIAGFIIIPDSLNQIPKDPTGLESIAIRERVADSVVVHKHSDLVSARQGKKPYWCWQVSNDGKSKGTDATRIYWAVNDEDAINYYCEKYTGQAIIIDYRCTEIYISQGKTQKRELIQPSLFN